MPKSKRRPDGRYCRQIYIGKGPDGKRKYHTVYAATAKEADRLAAEYRAALGRGLDPHSKARTVKDLLDALIAAKKAQGVGASWLRSLETHRDHLRPMWSMRADNVRTADVQATLNQLAESGDTRHGSAGGPLAHKTVGHIAGTLSAAFALAIPEVVQYNPCDKAVVPAGVPAKRREWLDEERQGWVLNTPHRAKRAAMVMMLSGLRRGEVTALTWADVDLDARTISVTKSWDFAAGRVKGPKTAAGERVVHIPRLLADYLRAEREADPDTLYVVHTARGMRMTDTAWRRMWASYMADLNVLYGYRGAVNKHATRKKDDAGNEQGTLPVIIRTFTPHELRHTFCTILYRSGVDVLTARDQMGHASVQVTQEIYTHLDAVYKAKKMEAVDKYLDVSV